MAVVTFTFAPIASRLLFFPTRSSQSQWFSLSPEFSRMRGRLLSDVTTRSGKPSPFRSPTAEPRW